MTAKFTRLLRLAAGNPAQTESSLRELLIRAADHIDGPVAYGCHCDLEPGMAPDHCCLNTGDFDDCVYARGLADKGLGPTACKYWRPVNA